MDNKIINLDTNNNFKPNNNIIINNHINTTNNNINNPIINNPIINNIDNISNVKTYKDNIKVSLNDIKKIYYKLLNDIHNINNMLNDIKQYNSLDITNISIIVNKHLLNLKKCLLNFDKSINILCSDFSNNISELNKTTDLLLVNKNKSDDCCCLLI